MISTHFSLSFPTKIDMFFPESVVCKCYARGPGGGGGGEATRSSQDPTVYISQKMPKIRPRGPFTLNYNFMNFVD